MLAPAQAAFVSTGPDDSESLRARLAASVCQFSQRLATQRSGCLAQVWVPGLRDDGTVTLHTQGLPFCIAGAGDLLALFRCVSCRYKFSTDKLKPGLMGSVGRVYSSGVPEMSHNIQKCDKKQFLRVEEAHRCRLNSALFMPLYSNINRQNPFAVFEAVQADTDVLFPVMVHWLTCCLQEVQLYTANTDNKVLTTGLRRSPFEVESSKESCSPGQQGSKSGPAHHSGNQASSSQRTEQDGNPQLPSQTHCSVSNLDSQEGAPCISSRSGSADRVTARLNEMMADSEELKDGAAGLKDGQGAPHSISRKTAPVLPPGGLSSTMQQQQQSADIQQNGSGGSNASTDMPASTNVPLQLASEGGRVQLQGLTAIPSGLQSPMSVARPDSSTPSDVLRSAPVDAYPGQCPQALPSQQQQQQQQEGTSLQPLRQVPSGVPIKSEPGQPHESMVQAKSATLHSGASAFDGYQAFGSGAVSVSQASSVQPPPEEEEPGSPKADQDIAINNRVAGGAGKRLSVEDLQSQFGVGLREAAHNLRICPTTLKRACRRHGITRWPRRQTWAAEGGLTTAPSEPLNLDGELGSPVSAQPAQQAQHTPAQLHNVPLRSALPTAGERTLSGTLMQSSTNMLAGLESLRAFTPPAQIALLQQLTAKAEPAQSNWLQGGQLQAALQASSHSRSTTSLPNAPTPSPKPPVRQLGSGAIVNMIAGGTPSQLPVKPALFATSTQHSPVDAVHHRRVFAWAQPQAQAAPTQLTADAQQQSLQLQALQRLVAQQPSLQQPGVQQQGLQGLQKLQSLQALTQQQGLQGLQRQQGLQGVQQSSLQQLRLQQAQAQYQQGSLNQLRRAHSATPGAAPSLLQSAANLASASSMPQPLLATPQAASAVHAAPVTTAGVPAMGTALSSFWPRPQHVGTSSFAGCMTLQPQAGILAMQPQTSGMFQTPGMPAQLARDGLHGSMTFLPNQTKDEALQTNVQASSAFAGTFAAPSRLAAMTDSKMAEQSPVMHLDSMDHGLGSLDLPDVCMDNLDALDFDPNDCLF